MVILSAGLDFDGWLKVILAVLGGVGVFLFGIEMMGASLKALAGNKMKNLIEKTTSTPLKGILVGALVTVVIQSSSGTTALVVSFVRSGLMTLPQAVGIIMGANIGTTITSFLIGLDIGAYSLLIIFIGAMLMFFTKKQKLKTIGSAILGFGLLFYGLELMGDGLKNITTAYNEQAMDLFTILGDIPILGVTVGAILTAVVQSSSAAIGILQSLYGTSGFPLAGAIAILLGSNIGTTVTAMLASVGGSKEAKQTAFIHFMFNVLGSVFFMIILIPFTDLVQLIEDTILGPLGSDPSMTIAVAHMIFNLVTTFIMYFFVKKLVILAQKVFKTNDDEEHEDVLLDETIIESSTILALEVAKKSVQQMARRCIKLFNMSKLLTFEYDEKLIDKSVKYEEQINSLDKRIHDYLTLMIKHNPDPKTSTQISKCLDIIRDLERIGDHCINIIEFTTENQSTTPYTEKAVSELNKIFSKVEEMILISTNSLTELNKEELVNVFKIEKEVDEMEAKYRKRHFIRINQKECTNTSYSFVEILSNLERIADHCNNVSTNLYTEEYLVDTDMEY